MALVTFSYTLECEGKWIDSGTKTFRPGDGTLLPLIESHLKNMRIGEEVTVPLPSDTYGEFDPKAEFSVDRNNEKISGYELKAGSPVEGEENGQAIHLVIDEKDGRSRQLYVKKLGKKSVVLTTNHPLAGKEVMCKLMLMEIKPDKPHYPKTVNAGPSNYYPIRTPCRRCRGAGRQVCMVCGGSGQRSIPCSRLVPGYPPRTEYYNKSYSCSSCRGGWKVCVYCHGTGREKS